MTNLRRDEPVRGSADNPSNSNIGPAGKPPFPSGSLPVSESFAWLWQQANQQLEQLKEDLKRERQRYQALNQRKTQLNSELASMRKSVESSRVELEAERENRVIAERELSSLRTGWKHVQVELGKLENERATRLKIERRLALLDTQSDKGLELAGQLAKERNLRLKLEREKGMLLNELRPRKEIGDRLNSLTASHSKLKEKFHVVSQRAAKLELALQHAVRLEKLLAEEKTTRLNADDRALAAEAKAARLEGELHVHRRNQQSGHNTPKGWLARLLFG